MKNLEKDKERTSYLQKYNVEEDPTDLAPPPLFSSLSLFSRLQL